MEQSMAKAFVPFKRYIKYLAQGKLDGYLDSIRRSDKVSVPEIKMSTDPNLLLHELGKHADMNKIGKLFSGGTVYLGLISHLNGTG